MNLPNKISLLRLILIPVMVAVFYIEFPYHYLVAGIVFAVAACTDFLDGFIARKYNLVTDLGKFLDSSADKVLTIVALVLLVEVQAIPFIFGGVMVSIVIAREIMISCLRMIAAAKGVVMAADKLGKIKTVLQDVSITALFVSFEFFARDYANILFLIGFSVFTLSVIMTLVSGVNYVIVNRAVLKSDKKD